MILSTSPAVIVNGGVSIGPGLIPSPIMGSPPESINRPSGCSPPRSRTTARRSPIPTPTRASSACEDDADDYWYFYDANGNVGQVIDAGDYSIAARYEYDPYGNEVDPDPTPPDPYDDINAYRFSTKWLDTELAGSSADGAIGHTGLYYYGYRYYSPRLGRWLNRDPIEEEGGPNLYTFVRNNSTSSFDPLGTIPSCADKEPAKSTVGDGWCYEGPNPFYPGLNCYRSYGDGEIGGQQCCYDPDCAADDASDGSVVPCVF